MRPGLAPLLFLLGGCSLLQPPEVGVKLVGPEKVYAELNETALRDGEPGFIARRALYGFDLTELHEDDPAAALLALHDAALEYPYTELRYALAELHFIEGARTGRREHYLAAAVYAYIYLMGEGQVERPSPYQRRFRWACDLYNRGLQEAFRDEDGHFELVSGTLTLPVGELRVTVDRSWFPWQPDDFPVLLPAHDFKVWGMPRYRDSGLGVPLVCVPRPDYEPVGRAGAYFPEDVSVPATAFLRIEGGLADALEPGLTARLELHSAFARPVVEARGQLIPLESDLTTALAYTLGESDLWQFGFRAFLRGAEADAGLEMTQPYSPGKVPVILIHGTASSPTSWAEMINFLQIDQDLRDRFQFWTYRYASGLPVSYSGAELRATLRELVQTVDPEGDDPYLRHMVLIGHSQGGLLVKQMAVQGELDWFERITGEPFSELTPEYQEIIRPLIEFEPSPDVGRVVFVSTPHRGSFLTKKPFAVLTSSLVQIPRELRKIGQPLSGAEHIPKDLRDRMPTAIESMRPDNPYLLALADAPIVDRIPAHSIIAVKGDGPPEEGNDGVVTYQSAHLDDVESELVVRSKHSCQSNPHTILEVRRILIEHLEGLHVEP